MTCPCLTSLAAYNHSNYVLAAGTAYTAYTPNSTYGEYGIGCSQHDVGMPPFCNKADPTLNAGWCDLTWCWTDPNNCNATDMVASNYLAHAATEAAGAVTYSYEACNSTDGFTSFYTAGEVHMCSVFSEDSASLSEIVGEGLAQTCGSTNTRAQVASMVSAINALNSGRGFQLPHAGAVQIPHIEMTYTTDTYPFGEWESVGRQKSLALFRNGTCDVVVGMANGCPDAEIQEQARLARDAGKIYVTGRGPREVLREAGNDGISETWVFSTHIRSDTYAEETLSHLRQREARSIAIIHESRAYGNNSFFAGLGEESERLARALGYDVRLLATVERPPGYNASSPTTFDAARLNAALEEAVASRTDVLLAVMRQPEWEHAVARLRELREPSADRADAASEPHSFQSIWFQGTSWGTYGDCLGLGPLVCGHAMGAEQMSRLEALDAYGDALLDGRTYRWLKASSHMTEPIDSYTDKPDGAMIPSIIAQVMQRHFRDRVIVDETRPLGDAVQYNELREFLSSGNEVARTFYGAVRFDRFGQNQGRVATTMQMDAPTLTASAANVSSTPTRFGSIEPCMQRDSTACGSGDCLVAYDGEHNTSQLVEGAAATPPPPAGMSSCPCLTSLAGYNHSNQLRAGGTWYTAFTPNSTYGDYGIGCSQHDRGLPPSCNRADRTLNVAWCSMFFCWVDPSNCNQMDVDPSSYLAHSQPVPYYSYDTCTSITAIEASAPSAADARPRARIILPTSISEVLLLYPSPARLSCLGARVRSIGAGTCLLCEAAECIDYSPPPEPPSLPPPLPPPPLPLPPPDRTLQIALSIIGVSVLLVLVLLCWLAQRVRRRVQAEAVLAAIERAEIMDAIESVKLLRFSAAMIPAADFFKLGKLESHEAMRSAGTLHYNDTLGELADAEASQRFYIFISQYDAAPIRRRAARGAHAHAHTYLPSLRLPTSAGRYPRAHWHASRACAPLPRVPQPVDVVVAARPRQRTVPRDGGSHQADRGDARLAHRPRDGVGRLHQHPAAQYDLPEGGHRQPRRVRLVRGGLPDRRAGRQACEHWPTLLAGEL